MNADRKIKFRDTLYFYVYDFTHIAPVIIESCREDGFNNLIYSGRAFRDNTFMYGLDMSKLFDSMEEAEDFVVSVKSDESELIEIIKNEISNWSQWKKDVASKIYGVDFNKEGEK